MLIGKYNDKLDTQLLVSLKNLILSQFCDKIDQHELKEVK